LTWLDAASMLREIKREDKGERYEKKQQSTLMHVIIKSAQLCKSV
jgi:hypothetical protein